MLGLIRDIHLAVSLFCTPFVLVYAMDGVRVNHGKLYPRDAVRSERSYEVSATDPEAIARELDARHGLIGRYWPPAGGESFANRPKSTPKTSEVTSGWMTNHAGPSRLCL